MVIFKSTAKLRVTIAWSNAVLLMLEINTTPPLNSKALGKSSSRMSALYEMIRREYESRAAFRMFNDVASFNTESQSSNTTIEFLFSYRVLYKPLAVEYPLTTR